jgi:predicted nucleotidyltransferase
MVDTTAASGRFVIRMEPALHAALRAGARATGVSLNEYCVRRLALPGPNLPGEAAAVLARAATVAGASLAGVLVFGSWARGEATEASDVDVLVVLDPARPITRALYDAWDAAPPLSWDGHLVEPHFVRLPDPHGRISGLWAEVALDGQVLFEREHDLSRRLMALRTRIAEGALVRRLSNGQPYWVAA